jgi:transcriptional repressor NrdR
MRCPFCSCTDTQVKNSRPTEDNAAIRRRRECPQCDGRFTTFERVKLGDVTVIKRGGDHVPFERDKIAKSIYTAMRKRPTSRDDVEKFISKIVQSLESHGDSAIPSRVIGEMVLNELANFDRVAYVRFASVYKDFQGSEDFNRFIAHLAQEEEK